MPSIETVEDLPVLDQDVAGQDAAGLGGVGQAGQDNTPATEVPLKLLTADGEEFVVEEDIMVRSRHIAKQVEGTHPILIPYPSTVVAFVRSIVDYCTHYRGEYLQADDPEAPRIPKRDPDDEGPSIVRVWDEEFLNVDRSTLYAILTAAHFLEVRSLVDSGTRIIANSIRGKTTEEMREILGIENDFSPEEEVRDMLVYSSLDAHQTSRQQIGRRRKRLIRR
ncbi:Skp1-domain-containing protein [Auriscalpium vulgare]|uniref:Skp1-domain-containing protein n=1 Tax=Auriscalpium vulgare TaxID=40419 RepID=A0ACB8RNE2_9AGAM|nr:Skp1-domain-containing protein [Auriscalpium vulgare]